MKCISFTLVIVYLLFPGCISKKNNDGNNLVPELNSYTEVVSNDDFDKHLDTNKWEFVADKFWNYNEIQEFTPKNSKTDNGNLQIHVHKDVINEDSVHYTSSSRKIEIPEDAGRIDIRVKFPTEKGILSAISLRNRSKEVPEYTGIDVAVIRGLGEGKYGGSFGTRF